MYRQYDTIDWLSFHQPVMDMPRMKIIEEKYQDLAFFDACENNNFFKVQRLISKGFDPSENQNKGLKLAVSTNAVATVKTLLLDPRVDPTAGLENLSKDNKIRFLLEREILERELESYKIILKENNDELVQTLITVLLEKTNAEKRKLEKKEEIRVKTVELCDDIIDFD